MAVILIVEDEEQIRVLVESYLQEQGHHTLSASTIAEALAVLDRTEDIDVLFADIILKGDVEAGIELAKQAVERRPRLKVVYATGQGVTDRIAALFVQNSALLPKPYTVEQLQTTLTVHFGIEPRAP
jgi:DNA-binding NtrC family response regulator